MPPFIPPRAYCYALPDESVSPLTNHAGPWATALLRALARHSSGSTMTNPMREGNTSRLRTTPLVLRGRRFGLDATPDHGQGVPSHWGECLSTSVRAAVMYGAGDVRVEEHPDPGIVEPTDAIITLTHSCICGSDLWPWRGIDTVDEPRPMGHEYAGTVVEVGAAVKSVRRGQFVVGSFFASDNTCVNCRAGYQTSCINKVGVGGSQADLLRVPLADGTLVATPDIPGPELVPSLLAASDVLGTGWFGAVAADAGPGKTVVVVGDGAVGLLAVLAARCHGAERIIAISRHAQRQRLAREFGATDIVEERDEEGIARIKDMTDGLGADSVVEAVGTRDAMMQAIGSARPGGHVGYVGVTHGDLPGRDLFFSHVHLHGGPAPVRRFLPDLIDLIWRGEINPGKVFDVELPLDQAADGYRAMDTRSAIKVLLAA